MRGTVRHRDAVDDADVARVQDLTRWMTMPGRGSSASVGTVTSGGGGRPGSRRMRCASARKLSTRAVAARKHRRHVVAEQRRGLVADGVDPVVDAPQAPVGEPVLDPPGLHAERDELLAR